MDILKGIDIALSLSVIYLIFALCVTALNEFVSAALSSRAKWLRRGITALLTPAGATDSAARIPAKQAVPANAPGLRVDDVYRSPFISALGRTSGLRPRFQPSYIAPWTLFQAILDAANDGKAQFHDVAGIRSAIEKLPERSPVKAVLSDLLARADNDIVKLRELVTAWFDSFGLQVSAWYRQKTQLVVTGLAAVLVLGTNLDTISLLRMLSTDEATRNALVTHALEVSQKEKATDLLSSNKVTELRKARDDAVASKKSPAEIDRLQAQLRDAQLELERHAEDLLKAVSARGVPLGWSGEEFEPSRLPLKIVGLLISVFALALGAPFWFDLLQKLASIRSVGKNLVERGREGAARTSSTSPA